MFFSGIVKNQLIFILLISCFSLKLHFDIIFHQEMYMAVSCHIHSYRNFPIMDKKILEFSFVNGKNKKISYILKHENAIIDEQGKISLSHKIINVCPTNANFSIYIRFLTFFYHSTVSLDVIKRCWARRGEEMERRKRRNEKSFLYFTA